MEVMMVYNWKMYHTQDNFSIDIISKIENKGLRGIREITFKANDFMSWMNNEGLLKEIFPGHSKIYHTTMGLKEHPVKFECYDGMHLTYMGQKYYISSLKTYILRGGRVFAPEYLIFYRENKPYYSFLKYGNIIEVNPE